MKYFILTTIALSAGLFSNAQTKQKPVASNINPHIRVYNQAMNGGDFTTATVALNYFLTERGFENDYTDTLAILYMQQGAYPQCYYWASKRLETKKDDNLLLEMKGICLDKLQQPKEAIDIFEKLFAKTQSPYHAYKLMELQYGIKRLSECLSTAIAAEKLTFKPDYLMTYSFGQQTGRTYLQAGVYNIHGLALYDLDKKAEAKEYFRKALSLDSSFALAKQNLEAIVSMEAGIDPSKRALNGVSSQNASPANKEN